MQFLKMDVQVCVSKMIVIGTDFYGGEILHKMAGFCNDFVPKPVPKSKSHIPYVIRTFLIGRNTS